MFTYRELLTRRIDHPIGPSDDLLTSLFIDSLTYLLIRLLAPFLLFWLGSDTALTAHISFISPLQ